MVDDFSELYFDQFLCMNHTRTVIDKTVYAFVVLLSTLFREDFPFVVCILTV